MAPAPWGPQVRQRARAAAEEWTLRAAPRPGARVWVTSVLILRIGVTCGGHRSMCRPLRHQIWGGEGLPSALMAALASVELQ